MSSKKTFKNNPALQFITEPADNRDSKQNEIFESGFDTISKTQQDVSMDAGKPPKGYKINPELYVETKSRRLQIVMQPSLYDRVKAAATKEDLSVNEYIHRVLDAATKK